MKKPSPKSQKNNLTILSSIFSSIQMNKLYFYVFFVELVVKCLKDKQKKQKPQIKFFINLKFVKNDLHNKSIC